MESSRSSLGSPGHTLGPLRSLDTVEREPLAEFWRRTRSDLVAAARGLPPAFEMVRVFGE